MAIAIENRNGNGQYAVSEVQEPGALFENLEKYKAFISGSDTGAWEYFSETVYLWCNDIYFSLLGRDINDIDHSGDANLKTVWTKKKQPDKQKQTTANFE